VEQFKYTKSAFAGAKYNAASNNPFAYSNKKSNCCKLQGIISKIMPIRKTILSIAAGVC
jgi:hypothetical protein